MRAIDFRQYKIIQRSLWGAIIICMIIPVLWVIIFDYSQARIVRKFIKTLGTQPANLVIETLNVTMLQKDNQIMVLSAPMARIRDINFSKIDFQTPIVKVYEPNKLPKFLSADTGVYDKKDNNITVLDNVKLTQENTLDVNSDKMVVDLNNFTFKLPTGVNGIYKTHSLKAKNVEIQDKTKKAIFKGGVKLVIDPSASKNI